MWEMQWKRWMRRKKNNSSHFTAFLKKIHRKIHRISDKNSPHMISKVYSIWFKFTRSLKYVSESWRSRLSSGGHAVGQSFEPVWGRFFFVIIQKTRWKKVFHRDSPHSPQKDVRNIWWKLFFFTAFLAKIHRQTSTREGFCAELLRRPGKACEMMHCFSMWDCTC